MNNNKKKTGKLKWIIIGIVVLIIIAVGMSGNSDKSSSGSSKGTKSDSSQTSDTEKDTLPEVIEEHYEIDLTAGNYTAGIDLPVGTYNLTATAGSGNVSSSNMYNGGLNEIMGLENDGYNQQTFNGLKMEEGVILSLGGDVTIHLVSDNARTQEVTPRSPSEGSPVDLQPGNYTAGTDFPAGTYNIIATGPSGNVSSSNMYDGGLNEIMGTDGFGIAQYNNARLDDKVTLEISGTSIQLVPVGE